MTSISAASGSNYQSPLERLQDELQSEANSGVTSSSDQGALSQAVTDIDASLQSDGAGNPTGNSNSAPGELKSKIDNLIAGEVSSGKLTSDQATELQGVFKTAFANGGASGGTSGPDGAGGAHHGHHGHHGGPPSADASSATDGTASTSSTDDILQQFLQSLQNSVSASRPSYGAAGSPAAGSSGSSVPPLLVDYQS
jgi:hypothetical protein